MLEKIVTGGQTGVDRAALDAAIELDFFYGGWCPKGRLAEDGKIDGKYNLQETLTSEYSERTKLNIRDSDGTLIIVPELPLSVTDGTVLTIQHVRAEGKPHFILNLADPASMSDVLSWADAHDVRVLNIAGPRESQSPGIYDQSCAVIKELISSVLQKKAVSAPKKWGFF